MPSTWAGRGDRTTDAVRQHERLAQIVRHHQGGRRPGRPYRQQQVTKPLGCLFVERDKRLIQKKDRRFGGESPGERSPARQAERKLRREQGAHAGEAETVEQPIEIGIPQALRQSQPDILLDAFATATASAPGTRQRRGSCRLAAVGRSRKSPCRGPAECAASSSCRSRTARAGRQIRLAGPRRTGLAAPSQRRLPQT